MIHEGWFVAQPVEAEIGVWQDVWAVLFPGLNWGECYQKKEERITYLRHPHQCINASQSVQNYMCEGVLMRVRQQKMEGEEGKWEDEKVCSSGRRVWDDRSILFCVKGR